MFRQYDDVRRQALYIANTAAGPHDAMEACFGHFLRTPITPRDFLVMVAAVEDVTGWRVGKGTAARNRLISYQRTGRLHSLNG